MKKICSTILFTVVYIACASQVVVDGTNFIQGGIVLNYQSSGPIWNDGDVLINTNGESAVWNATDWTSQIEDSEVYNSLAGMSPIIKFFFDNEIVYSDNYSTHALEVGSEMLELPLPLDISDGYNFFRTDETGYYGTGLSFSLEGFPLITQNEVVERIYKFPMYYGDRDTSALMFLISVPGLGAYGQNADRYSEVDGQGTLITPFGTYDVLRIRSERYISDTLYAEELGGGQSVDRPLQIDYAWISQEMQGPILEISVVEDVVTSARMLVGQSTLSVFNTDKQDLGFYPNPTRDFIEFNSPIDAKAVIEIYDTLGRLVLKTISEGNRIQLNSISPGMYVVNISGNGENRILGKVLIIE